MKKLRIITIISVVSFAKFSLNRMMSTNKNILPISINAEKLLKRVKIVNSLKVYKNDEVDVLKTYFLLTKNANTIEIRMDIAFAIK